MKLEMFALFTEYFQHLEQVLIYLGTAINVKLNEWLQYITLFFERSNMQKKNGDMNNAVDEVDLIDVFLKDIFETINLSFQMFTTVFLNNNCYIFVLNSSLLWGLSCAL